VFRCNGRAKNHLDSQSAQTYRAIDLGWTFSGIDSDRSAIAMMQAADL
jgi:hypothetical protein